MLIQIALTMFAVGLLLGFVGAGGSGFIISILTFCFGYPLHTALGTALTAMIFSSFSGAVSHYREGNTLLRTGIAVGICGAAAAWLSTQISGGIPAELLKWMTAAMLYLSGLALWLRMTLAARAQKSPRPRQTGGLHYWLKACAVGLVTGALSGLFGIGATPFIQIGLMTVLGLSVRVAAGTTLLVILPIAMGGSAGFYRLGFLDARLLLAVTIGIMLGVYLGAKFTRRVPAIFLKTSMVIVPMIGATILLL